MNQNGKENELHPKTDQQIAGPSGISPALSGDKRPSSSYSQLDLPGKGKHAAMSGKEKHTTTSDNNSMQHGTEVAIPI